jgi:hypothetical protein
MSWASRIMLMLLLCIDTQGADKSGDADIVLWLLLCVASKGWTFAG